MLVEAKKKERLNIRTTADRKDLIARAAKKENMNISEFVLETAVSAAEAIVNDDANYTLSKDKWDAFCSALDAPPRDIPALRKLLTEPSIFDAK